MMNFTKNYGKPICVVLYSVFSAMAAKKQPWPLVILLGLHTMEYFTKAKKVAQENDISTPATIANCLSFGFTWWLPIKKGE